MFAQPVLAGSPFVTDDPEPTEFEHFEIYTFASGGHTDDGNGEATGIDLNYGAGENLQLTFAAPLELDAPSGGSAVAGIGNIEIAAKYRFLRQADVGLDVAVFPRVFLPSLSRNVGDHHASFLLPIWLQRDFAGWSVFGGGGCVLNRSHESRNYCIAGGAATYRVSPRLTVGAEVYHQGADARGAKPSTMIGAGLIYDLSETYHLMAALGPGLQYLETNDRHHWYTALQITF